MSNKYLSELFKSGEEFEAFLRQMQAFKEGVERGDIQIPSALKATQDGNGNNIGNTYAKKSDLTNGSIKVNKATNADKATNDSNGNKISDTYATKSGTFEDMTVGKLKASFKHSFDTVGISGVTFKRTTGKVYIINAEFGAVTNEGSVFVVMGGLGGAHSTQSKEGYRAYCLFDQLFFVNSSGNKIEAHNVNIREI